jgi:hypothetical protein
LAVPVYTDQLSIHRLAQLALAIALILHRQARQVGRAMERLIRLSARALKSMCLAGIRRANTLTRLAGQDVATALANPFTPHRRF